ncbi:hypothetical protein SDJN02_19901, partial [Cucurbita argyrosperma subsp. argyrosperma]
MADHVKKGPWTADEDSLLSHYRIAATSGQSLPACTETSTSTPTISESTLDNNSVNVDMFASCSDTSDWGDGFEASWWEGDGVESSFESLWTEENIRFLQQQLFD